MGGKTCRVPVKIAGTQLSRFFSASALKEKRGMLDEASERDGGAVTRKMPAQTQRTDPPTGKTRQILLYGKQSRRRTEQFGLIGV